MIPADLNHIEKSLYFNTIIIYRISGNFPSDLIFTFLALSIKSQIIEYAKIISCIIFYRKLLKLQKND